jgi:selenocysteine-specific elongation factor
MVESYHKSFPLRRGIPREELKSRLQLSARVFGAVINKLLGSFQLTTYSNSVALPGHEIKFDNDGQAKVQALRRKFEQSPFSPPSFKDCQTEVGEEILNALIEMNELIPVSSDVIFRKEDYDFMTLKIRATLLEQGKITLAEVRNQFSNSRKYAQALLEYLDAIGITTRDGDFRRLRES